MSGIAPSQPRAPAVLRPERFRTGPRPILAPSASPKAAFQRPSTRAVRLPERFRGGCAFGAGGDAPASPARVRERCGRRVAESSSVVPARLNAGQRSPAAHGTSIPRALLRRRRGVRRRAGDRFGSRRLKEMSGRMIQRTVPPVSRSDAGLSPRPLSSSLSRRQSRAARTTPAGFPGPAGPFPNF